MLIPQAAAFTAGCLAGLVLTPDLDVNHSIHADGLIRRSGGCLLGTIWSVLWWPYARLIPHHRWNGWSFRSPLSHWPVLGTAIRLAYLLVVPALLWWVLGQFISLPALSTPHLTPLWKLPPFYHADGGTAHGVPLGDWGCWAIGGLALADLLHAVLDRRF